jgi:hypothetical protein
MIWSATNGRNLQYVQLPSPATVHTYNLCRDPLLCMYMELQYQPLCMVSTWKFVFPKGQMVELSLLPCNLFPKYWQQWFLVNDRTAGPRCCEYDQCICVLSFFFCFTNPDCRLKRMTFLPRNYSRLARFYCKTFSVESPGVWTTVA